MHHSVKRYHLYRLSFHLDTFGTQSSHSHGEDTYKIQISLSEVGGGRGVHRADGRNLC